MVVPVLASGAGAVRTLPIRLAPLGGEALDSWLETLAQRLHSPLGELLRHLSPPAATPGNHPRGVARDWTILLSEPQSAAIAHASGLAPDTVSSMTLAHYDQRAVRINVARRRVDRWVLWGRGSGSRFCPDCLAASGGRWRLVWRLGWAFACPDHARLLADRCPECGRVPRSRPRSGKTIPRPGRCGSTPSREGGPVSGGCGFDLARTVTLRLPAADPALAAQRQVLELIDIGIAAFGAYAFDPQPARKALCDLRALGAHTLAELPARLLTEVVSPDLARAHQAANTTPRRGSGAEDRPGFMSPPHAASTAVAVSTAWRILGQPDAHHAGTLFRELLHTARHDLGGLRPSATGIDNWGRGLSPVLTAVHLAAIAGSLRPSEQLRYRTATALPRRPTRTNQQVRQRSRTIPNAFWPSWTPRFRPPGGVSARVLGPALASTLLVIDTKTSLDQAAEHLATVTGGHDLSRVLQLLHHQPQWPNIAVALTRLVDYLDTHDVPINYHRRRHLDYTDLLPTARWREICRHTDTNPGDHRRVRIVRCQLFERLSGLPAHSGPHYPTVRQAQFRADAARFLSWQTPQLAEALTGEALRFLAAHRIRDEPVTWQPPSILLDGLELPGPDPTHIDVARLHQLIQGRRNPVRHAAHALATSIDAVRAVLIEHPAPAPPLTAAAARAAGHIRRQASQQLPKALFSRLYLDQYRSLAQIAKLTGISRAMLTALAHDYGIPLRDGPGDYTRRGTIDRDWLYEQYVHHRRTLPELAREKGMSTANMTRWAHTHNIPLRPRGAASHRTALHPHDQPR